MNTTQKPFNRITFHDQTTDGIYLINIFEGMNLVCIPMVQHGTLLVYYQTEEELHSIMAVANTKVINSKLNLLS